MRDIVRTPSRLDAEPASGRGVRTARFLGFGGYTVLLTATGTGTSWWRDHVLTSGPGDRLEDSDGLFIAIRDLDAPAEAFGFFPGTRAGVHATWEPGAVRFTTAAHDVEAALDVCVVPGRAAELRRVTLRNLSDRPRRLEIVSFAAVVLNRAAAHASHPVFSKLFVQTEVLPEARAVLVRRRPRSPEEEPPWMAHGLVERAPAAFETSRDAFLGRGRDARTPRALEGDAPRGMAGNVLDPLVSLRDRVELPPGRTSTSTFVLAAGATREDTGAVLCALAAPGAVEAAFAAAASEAEDLMRHCEVTPDRAEEYEALAAAVLANDPALRDRPAVRPAASAAAAARHRVAADRPLALCLARSATDPAAAAFAEAARYWDALGIPLEALRITEARGPVDGVRTLAAQDVDAGAREALRATARMVVDGSFPAAAAPPPVPADGRAIERAPLPRPSRTPAATDESLELSNGTGGFADDGREYVLRLRCRGRRLDDLPPRPWTNVIAGETFGFLVSETGAGATWCGNSREHRLTEWSNDPLRDPHGDALWLRDDDAGAVWSPLPGPLPAPGDYEVRHGIGYTTWRHATDGLSGEATMFVPSGLPVRVTLLTLENTGGTPRRLSVFAAARPVLGAQAADTAGVLQMEDDPGTGAILARNPLAGPFSSAFAFAAVAPPATEHALEHGRDRDAFLGRNGAFAAPEAVLRGRIPPDPETPGDPFFAHRVALTLAPGSSVDVAFLLGQGDDRAHAGALIRDLRRPGAVRAALAGAKADWRAEVDGVRITTPSRALDVTMNAWLPYQTLSCRLNGRTAFYQSGGAFGFRDQLQDAAALTWLDPARTRAQILLHAAHQFVEGDVLHWWHPPGLRGLRTRFADDLLWLPALAAGYVAATGDRGILDEPVRFLRARPLRPHEDEVFLEAEDSGERADLFEHCRRAIERSLEVGAHGLPLFGTGDWNDGMNRVGREGRGESVWMAFFLGGVLRDFAPFARARGDDALARRWEAHREALVAAVERSAWDGAWYLRAFYDDGTPLGSHQGDECRIDALAQAWSVLSGMAAPERAERAMDAVEEHLVSEDERLVRLLAPPFENTPHDPGYIKGYVRGVRENGGQYTHAALWVVAALAKLGRRDRAARVLELLNPVHHARDAQAVATYQVEPYVVAADVYGEPPHVGRGGWTWYTGSAGWMVRACLESVLGLTVAGGTELRVAPCIPDEWPGFSFRWRVPDGRGTTLELRVTRGDAPAATLDGASVPCEGGVARIPLPGDGGAHTAHVVLGPAS